MTTTYQSDVIIIGGGLAGITTAYQLLDEGQKVIILDRDIPDKLGGLAKKSFGGIMMVGTPEQKKSRIPDSIDLAWQDWQSYAEFDDDDVYPKQWAEYYVQRSRDVIYDWLIDKSVKFMRIVNWPERGYHVRGNSLPRWHITWGTGYGLVTAILEKLDQHPNRSNLTIHFDHRVENLIEENGRVIGCAGQHEQSGEDFEARGDAIVIAAGGICGGDLSRLRNNWYKPWGEPPEHMVNGAHLYGDGTLHDAAEAIGANLTHLDRHWHYAAGVHHPLEDGENRGLSLVPPRSALWVNAEGERIGGNQKPLVGYTDTRYLIEQILQQPGKFSWQVMNWKIAIKELAVSGSIYMKAFRNKSYLQLVRGLLLGNKSLVNELIETCEDFVVANSLPELVEKMNAINLGYTVNLKHLEADIKAYDAEIERGKPYFWDEQLRRIMNFRQNFGDRLRLSKYQKILDQDAMPLIAVREFLLTRKSLGGIQTDLESRVLRTNGEAIPGLYAVGEAAGFGGGGIHGMRSLEGTFLGSCVLTGRVAGKAIVGKNL